MSRPVCLVLGALLAIGVSTGRAADPEHPARGLRSRALPGLRADVATLMMQGATGGAIDLAVAAMPEAGTAAGSERRLSLVVEVSGASILAAAAEAPVGDSLAVEVYAYAVGPEGLVLAYLARRVAIRTGEWRERLAAGGIRFAEDLGVPDGELSVRTLVLIPEVGRFGMAVSEVPGRGSGEPALASRPRFESPCDDWVSVASRGVAAPIRSSALPVWWPGERVEVLAGQTGSSPAEAEIFGLLRSPRGDEVRMTARAGASRSGTDWTAFTFEVPEVEAGVHSFSITRDGDGASAAADVWIAAGTSHEAGAESRPCAWPDVMVETRRAPADVAPVIAGSRSGSLRKTAKKSYLEVLKRLGRGEAMSTVVDELVTWEAAALGEESRKNLATILAAEIEVTSRLARADPESLLPVFSLHRAAYEEHFARGAFALAGHSRRTAATVAEMWLAGPEPGAGGGWVGDALVVLAGSADRHLMFEAGQALLQRAVEVDPLNREGRLLLAMLCEKLGDYRAAAGYLEDRLLLAPADAEARLRLATLEQRLGRPESSRSNLRRVIAQRPRPWILSLAYQTLVKGLYAEGSFGEGLRALEEADLVLPGDAELGLARAYGLDRLGRGREALLVLQRLPRKVDEERSSRLLYAEAAGDLARRAESRLRRNVMIRQPRLGRALGRTFEDAP